MLVNDPAEFRAEMLKGYVAAYPSLVTECSGGVVRATVGAPGKTMVINGGGSGHFPAFCGLTGEGLMDGCVVGNVFTSPSTQDVLDVAAQLDLGAGLMVVGGNYAGDRMNFDLARDRLRAEGVDCRTFYITDDVASAEPGEKEKRRGNVGTFFVFKAAGAAAAEGMPLEEVERVCAKANDAVRTMSIGLHGPTLPGEDAPLFTVPAGVMEVGQGIHGEPGVGEMPLASAREVASLLVDRVLAEAPEGVQRIAVVLDGLGSTKYEELFVLWGAVRDLLERRGLTLVEPVVGEVVTSLDMAGVALSVEFLDDELERLWLAPALAPGFRRGGVVGAPGAQREVVAVEREERVAAASSESRLAAGLVVHVLTQVLAALEEHEEELARIDSLCGDGDHGRGMVNGATGALEAARRASEAGAGAGSTLIEAGRGWTASAGGTSGVLWGNGLEAAGAVLGDEAAPDGLIVARAAREAMARVQQLGGARLGDKTLLDALAPFSEELAARTGAGEALADAWREAAQAAQDAAERTASLLARVGRGRPAAERALGTPDPGALSLALCLRVAGDASRALA